MTGGIIFVSGISGTNIERFLDKVFKKSLLHGDNLVRHDIGELMYNKASSEHPDMKWEHMLDMNSVALNFLRSGTFDQTMNRVLAEPDKIHIIDMHLCFRWKNHLTSGFSPQIIKPFIPFVRFFVNLVEDVHTVQNTLKKTEWEKTELPELLIWKDEEFFLSEIFANICDVPVYQLSVKEPFELLWNIIMKPEMKKAYLSFPITKIRKDKELLQEIDTFRDEVREFLVAFNPFSSKEYDETYKNKAMKLLKIPIGEATKRRDFRLIDQSDGIIVYYPKKVYSKGVDAEMAYAHSTRKPIFLYCPEEIDTGPFLAPIKFMSQDRDEFINHLKNSFH